jgi:serine/threonine protein kinase
LVFEFVEFDLKKLMDKSHVVFTKPQLQHLFRQIMDGLCFMHANKVIHRDVKSENLLVDPKGNVKFADFGLARDYFSDVWLTQKVVTRYYRSPENCLCDARYTPKVDVWSVACVFAEVVARMPLFPGKSDLDQFICICTQMLPTNDHDSKTDFDLPSDLEWPGLSDLVQKTYPGGIQRTFLR